MQDIINRVNEIILTWDPDILKLIITGLALIIAGISAIIVNYIITSKEIKEKYNKIVDSSKKNIENGLKSSSIKIFNYTELEQYLNSNGVTYMSDGKITPLSYIAIRFGAALFGLAIGAKYSVVTSIGFMLGLFFLPDFIIKESNKSDNKKMLDDIKNVYDTLRIQSKAGVFISDILSDCYTVVANKRLKQGFLKLSSDIMANSDLAVAMERFNSMYSNEYLSTLAVIIEQSMRTGQTAKMFDDIKKQLEDIDISIMAQEKIRIQRKIAITQTMIYTAVIAAALFLAAVSLQSGMNF